MRLPDNKYLSGVVLLAPPLVATGIPLLLLRWGLFYQIVGAACIWFTIQVCWSFMFERDDPFEDEELFL